MAELDYDEAIKINQDLQSVVSKEMWDFVQGRNTVTCNGLGDLWKKNIKENIKKFYGKCGSVGELAGLGKNKAVIAIGAGPSLKNNIDLIRALSLEDGTKPYHEQNFIFITSNHQFKPCLKQSIIPHFVMICDAGEHLLPQVCKKIPPNGQATILLASLQVYLKIIVSCLSQGSIINFFLGVGDELKELFEKETKESVSTVATVQGGNILNNIWTLSGTHLKSTVYMAVGNDLSYPRGSSLKEQRKNFYADGDYSTNLASKRDEARYKMDWMGFKFYDNVLSVNGNPFIELYPVRTTMQFLTYKLWLETTVALNAARKGVFRYYNCSEGGILGVKCKEEKGEGMFDRNNWYLLDEVLPKRWCTRRLKDAVIEFLTAKEMMRKRYVTATSSEMSYLQ